MEAKEERIRKITRFYYSSKRIQETMLSFSQGREVVPRYFEAFGKRPDSLQYLSDINELVKKGATSFHCSEEIWIDPLKINSEMTIDELKDLRIGYDLIIDIDSKYFDYSKIAAKLMLSTLEESGIKNYNIKFSGSRGWHIIISWKAFPEEFNGKKAKEMFPEWPRTICEFLINKIRPVYNKHISNLEIDFKALKERTNLSKEEISEVVCEICSLPCKKGKIIEFVCSECKTSIKRKDPKITKRKLACINNSCPGKLSINKEEDYYFCEYCNLSSINKKETIENKKTVYTKEAKFDKGYSSDFIEGISGNILAGLDLVLVAPRHLFRMPYSLHEKTALASVVLNKEEIDNFDPVRDADPLRVKIRDFLTQNKPGEATKLLGLALEWKKMQEKTEERLEKKSYDNYSKIDISNVSEEDFPKPIKKLLKGLKEGRKRGLFVLLTFLRSLNFSPEYINEKIREWNKKNDQPLKEGYIKSQIDWHLKQKRKILPPNYNNDNFYRDLNLLDEKPRVKNPIVEVVKKLRRSQSESF